MDIDELKTYLDGKFEAIDRRHDATIRLIEDTSASLHREFHREIGTLRETVEGVQRRLDRQASLIQVGARYTTRMVGWSEKVDVVLDDLTARVQALEKRNEHP